MRPELWIGEGVEMTIVYTASTNFPKNLELSDYQAGQTKIALVIVSDKAIFPKVSGDA